MSPASGVRSSSQVSRSASLAYREAMKKAVGKGALNRNPAEVARVMALYQGARRR